MAPTSSDQPSDDIVAGRSVILNGLVGRPYLNGRVGHTVKQVSDERFAVQLHGPWTPDPEAPETTKNDPMSLKRTNLIRLKTCVDVRMCGFCMNSYEKSFTMKCGTCRRADYCSKECQRKAWPKHKTECKNMRLARKERDSDLPSIPKEDVKLRYEMRERRSMNFMDRGNGVEAEKEIRLMIEEFDLHVQHIYTRLAGALQMQGRHEESLSALRHALELPMAGGCQTNVEHAQAYAILGNTLMSRHDYEGARDAWQSALKIHSECSEAAVALSRLDIYLKRKNDFFALPVYDRP